MLKSLSKADMQTSNSELALLVQEVKSVLETARLQISPERCDVFALGGVCISD